MRPLDWEGGLYLGHGKLHGQKYLVGEVGSEEALVWKSL